MQTNQYNIIGDQLRQQSPIRYMDNFTLVWKAHLTTMLILFDGIALMGVSLNKVLEKAYACSVRHSKMLYTSVQKGQGVTTIFSTKL